MSNKAEQIADKFKEAVIASDSDETIIIFRKGDDIGLLVNASDAFGVAAHEYLGQKLVKPTMLKAAKKFIKDHLGEDTHPTQDDDPLDKESEGFKMFERIKAASDRTQ